MNRRDACKGEEYVQERKNTLFYVLGVFILIAVEEFSGCCSKVLDECKP
jgi:hypothetical protein